SAFLLHEGLLTPAEKRATAGHRLAHLSPAEHWWCRDHSGSQQWCMLRCFSSCRRLSRDAFVLGQRPSNDACAEGKAGPGGGSSQEPASITRSKQPPLTPVDLRSLPQGRFALITG